VDKYVRRIVSSSQAGKQMGEIEFQGGAQSVFAQASELGEQAGEHMSKMTEEAGKRMGEIDFKGDAQNALAQASELGEQAGEHMSKMTEQARERMGEIGFQGSTRKAFELSNEPMDQMENTINANLSDASPYASAAASDVAQYASAAASKAKQQVEGAGVYEAVSDTREFAADSEVTQQAAVLGGAALEAARNVDMGAVGDTVFAYGEQAVSKIGSMILDSGMLESGLQVNTPCAFLL